VLKRLNAILIAATAHGLLALTVWYLFPFLTPFLSLGELLGEVGGAGAGFEGGAADGAETSDGLFDGVGVVGDGAVAQDGAGRIEDANLDGALGVVEADEEWYSGVHVGLLQMGKDKRVTPVGSNYSTQLQMPRRTRLGLLGHRPVQALDSPSSRPEAMLVPTSASGLP
jgi:hypothetical protein